MRYLFLLFFLLIFSFLSFAQDENPNFDASLAEKLAADDYGMKTYILVMLTSGSNESKDKEHRTASFAGHMENINRLVKEEKLVVAGPFLKNERDYRGLFILNVDNLEDAALILDSDPAIKENYLGYEMYPWYGSAALSEYLEASDKVWKINP